MNKDIDFEELLYLAKQGSKEAIETIFYLYQPLLIKNAFDFNKFDEDLYQELCKTLLLCIRKFKI